VQRVVKRLEIIAGENAEEILDYIMQDISLGFCTSDDEFKYEYENEKGKKYRLMLQIEEAF
jgi:hypothetical protein